MLYKKRIADTLLKEQLEAAGAVLIQGPKWCGKTTTAEQIAGSKIYMNAPDRQNEFRMLVDTNIQRLFSGGWGSAGCRICPQVASQLCPSSGRGGSHKPALCGYQQ